MRMAAHLVVERSARETAFHRHPSRAPTVQAREATATALREATRVSQQMRKSGGGAVGGAAAGGAASGNEVSEWRALLVRLVDATFGPSCSLHASSWSQGRQRTETHH